MSDTHAGRRTEDGMRAPAAGDAGREATAGEEGRDG